MADWGILTPIYNLGASVGQIAYNAGASAGAAVAPYLPSSSPAPTPTPAPAPSQSVNPVTAATQYYNQNFNVTTPGATSVQFAPTPIASPIASTPAQDLQGQIGGIGKGIADFGIGTFGAIAGAGAATRAAVISISPFSQQAAIPSPAVSMGSPFSPIDAPHGTISENPFTGPFIQQPPPRPGEIFYVPGGLAGDRGQIAIEKAKVVFGQTAGDVGFYQTPKSIYEDAGFTRKYGWVTSSGGPGALQSGQFSTEPLSAAIYTQESGGQKLASGANPLAAAEILKNPEGFSRLGAEAYGGFVQPLDNRVLPEGTQMSRYAAGGNLANLVNPEGVNQPKSQWEEIPWGIETKGAPTIQSIDIEGRLSAPMTIAKAEIGGATPAPGFSLGGKVNTGATPAPSAGGLSLGLIPPVSAAEPTGGITIWGGPTGIPKPGAMGGATPAPEPTFGDTIFNAAQNVARVTFSTMMMPGLAIASDTFFSVVKGKPEEAPFYDFTKDATTPYVQKEGTVTKEQYESNLAAYNTQLSEYNTGKAAYEAGGSKDTGAFEKLQGTFAGLQTTQTGLESQQKNIVNPPTMFDTIGKAYENLNKGLAPYTTDIPGIGKALKATPDIDLVKFGDTSENPIYSGTINFAKGVYIGVSQHPVDIAVTYAGGELFKGLEWGGAALTAKAAESGLPVLGTMGRAASTPVAADVMTVGKTLFGAYIIGGAAGNIISQPTPELMGEAAGRTTLQFGGFGAGYGNLNPAEPANRFSGRGFFSGKPEIGPLEKLQFTAETTIRSYMTEHPEAYQEVATIVIPGRTIEPPIKAEPNLEILTRSGEFAPEIKSTLMEQPHSVIGSSTIIQQYPPEIAESTGLRIGKDVDALIRSPSEAITSLSARTGLSEPSAKEVLDLHVIPQKYPGLKPSIELETTSPESSSLTDAFGNPYRSIAFPRGVSEVITPGAEQMTYEAGQVGFGRKGAAVSVFIENPIGKGYRGEKDIYDFVTEYAAQKAVALSQGISEGKFTASDEAMQSFMEREFTYGTVKGQKIGDENPTVTRSVRSIYDEMFQSAKESRATVRMGGEAPGVPEPFTESGVTPSRGYVSEFTRSAPPSAIVSTFASGIFGSPSPARSPGSSVVSMPSAFSPSDVVSGSPSIFSPSSPASPSPYRFAASDFPSPSPSGKPSPSIFPSSDIGSPSPSPSPFPSLFPTGSPPPKSPPTTSFPPTSFPPSLFPPSSPPPSTPPKSPGTPPPPPPPPGFPGLPLSFGGGSNPFAAMKGKHAFQERFKVMEGIRFGELGIGRKGKGQRLKL